MVAQHRLVERHVRSREREELAVELAVAREELAVARSRRIDRLQIGGSNILRT